MPADHSEIIQARMSRGIGACVPATKRADSAWDLRTEASKGHSLRLRSSTKRVQVSDLR